MGSSGHSLTSTPNGADLGERVGVYERVPGHGDDVRIEASCQPSLTFGDTTGPRGNYG
jgi:hypothetical protein